MDILQSIRLYFWAAVGALAALFLLSIAIAAFVQGARRDALALTRIALALALAAVSLDRMAGGEEGWLTAVAGVTGLALFVLTVKYGKPDPGTPPRTRPEKRRHGSD